MVAILSKLVLAELETGALSIAARVVSLIGSGTDLGPLDWEGHAGEKWSFCFAQHGQIYQWDDFLLAARAGAEGFRVGEGLAAGAPRPAP